MNTRLDGYGWDDGWARLARAAGGEPGRVVRQDRGWVQVVTDDGPTSAKTRADRVGTPVVGDWVTLDGVDDDDADTEVRAVLDRRNRLRRADPVGEGAQVLAANLDRVFVVLGLDRPVKDGRILRLLVQIHDAEAHPVVVLTKADTLPVVERDAIADDVRADHPDADVVLASAHDGTGLEDLRNRARGGTTVLVGESGAGKSSLLNALAGGDRAETGAVRDGDAKGRHTTTRREAHRVEHGVVVDTPGVRAVGLYAALWAVEEAFPDIAEAATSCRFSDCAHDAEPGCGVRRAIDAGTIAADRYATFVELRAEAEFALLPAHERRRRR